MPGDDHMDDGDVALGSVGPRFDVVEVSERTKLRFFVVMQIAYSFRLRLVAVRVMEDSGT